MQKAAQGQQGDHQAEHNPVFDPMQHGHLLGDVPALLLVAVVLGGLMMAQGRRRNV